MEAGTVLSDLLGRKARSLLRNDARHFKETQLGQDMKPITVTKKSLRVATEQKDGER